MTPREALIEAAAKLFPSSLSTLLGERSISDAIVVEAALSALEAAGAVVVPREATGEMREAAAAYRIEEAASGWDATAADIWNDMLAASPYAALPSREETPERG